MKQWQWKAGIAGVAAVAVVLGAGRLAAQANRHPGRAGLVRNPALAGQSVSPQIRAQRVQAQARQTGLFLVLVYNLDQAVDLDLDDNGSVTDTGDVRIRQGEIWLSNRNGAKVQRVGRFASNFQYLDVSGEATGTDLTQVTDLFFERDGQLRASGFWNVDDGVGAPALHIDGTTGRASGLRRYQNGQFTFLGTVNTADELWFLGR